MHLLTAVNAFPAMPFPNIFNRKVRKGQTHPKARMRQRKENAKKVSVIRIPEAH